MFLRKLTDDEIKKIKKLKDAANRTIKTQRKKLTAEMKQYRNNSRKVASMINQLDYLSVITGYPVVVKVEDESVCLNYDLLKKFERSLYKSGLSCASIKIESKSLIVRYGKYGQSGILELTELPAYQTELLAGLPTIDLKE